MAKKKKTKIAPVSGDPYDVTVRTLVTEEKLASRIAKRKDAQDSLKRESSSKITIVRFDNSSGHVAEEEVEVLAHPGQRRFPADYFLKDNIETISGKSYDVLMEDIEALLKRYDEEQKRAILGSVINVLKAADKNKSWNYNVAMIVCMALKGATDYVNEHGPKRETLPPPEEHTPRFVSVAKSGKASVYLNFHWSAYLAQNALYQHTLKKIDPKLMQALENEFRGRRSELRAILPTKQAEVTARLEKVFGGPVRPEDRAIAVRGLSAVERSKPH